MLDATALLQAGALLPLHVQTDGADRVAAHSFAHPGLADPVIRLVPEGLVAGSEAEMEALGFAKQGATPALALTRRRAPGFPGWALLHDPKNARYALAVVQELKKATRRMTSKPGHAKDALVAIAQKLSRSTPHFLPSYWEECARLFLAAGNRTFAAQCFEKAREAERQYGLQVVEEVRAEAFLEFALAGALTAKSLAAYGKSLLEIPDKGKAFAAFAHLCLKRTLGGMPPWAGMAKDLRGLAKAAKLDPDGEELSFITQVLHAPALVRAPAEVWKAWQAPLKKLCAAQPETVVQLLDLWPRPQKVSDEAAFAEQWSALLVECGGRAWLQQAPKGKPAAWLSKLLRWSEDHPRYVCDWLGWLGARLASDQVPLALEIDVDDDDDHWYGELDARFVELALTHGVPLGENENLSIDLLPWAQDGETAEDLPRTVADARFGPLFLTALDRVFGEEAFEKVARGKVALRAGRAAWLDKHIGELGDGALLSCADALETLEEKTSPELFGEFPEALEKLRAVAVAPLLQKVLNAGVFDELGWPALEAVVAELRGTGKTPADVEVSGAYPWLVAHNFKRAVVVGPNGPVFSHDLKLPKGGRLFGLRYACGQLLVVFRNSDYDGKAYWSSKPAELLDVENEYSWRGVRRTGVILADGSFCNGGKALRPGMAGDGGGETLLSDGRSCWVWDDGRRDGKDRVAPGWCLLDPQTGKQGERNTPPWLAIPLPGGTRWGDYDDQQWLPAPAGLQSSPLGLADGQVGVRIWESIPPKTGPDAGDEGVVEWMVAEGIDGRRWHGFVDGDEPNGLLRYPGSEQVLAAVGDSDVAVWQGAGEDDDAVKIQDVDEDDDDRPAGTPLLPPLAFWHFMQTRDLQGSQALRALNGATAQALLDAGVAHANQAQDKKEDDEAELPLEVVARVMPALNHPGLQAGVAQQVAFAADLQVRLGKLTSASEEVAAVTDGLGEFNDNDIQEAIGRQFLGHRYGYSELAQSMAAARAQLEVLPPAGGHALPASDLPWLEWVGQENTLIALACSVGAAHRENAKPNLLALLRRLAAMPWTQAPGQFERQKLSFASDRPDFVLLGEFDEEDYEPEDPKPVAASWVYSDGQRAWIVQRTSDDTDRPIELYCLHFAPTGEFALPEGTTSAERTPLPGAPWRERLETAISLAETHDFSVLPAGVAEALAERTGLSRPEAAWLWAGLPVVSRYAADFMGKPLRDALGLKLAEAKAAKTSLGDLESGPLWAMFAAALPEDPAGLREPLQGSPSPVERFAQAYADSQGKRVPLPPELLTEVERRLSPDLDTRELLTALADPGLPSPFARDAAWTMDAYGSVDQADAVPSPFDLEAATSLAKLVPFVATQLAAGDPMRSRLAELTDLARQRLANPNLLFSLDTWYGEDRGKKKRKAWFEALGGEPFAPKLEDAEAKPPLGRDAGLVLAVLDDDACPSAAWRPARVRDEHDWQQLQGIVDLFSEGSDGALDEGLAAVRFLQSAGCLALAARATACPLPAGMWEQNPLQSAPEVVAAAQKQLKSSQDAAVLYLQLLTLAAPTQRDVLVWNGWKAPQYKKAAEELASLGLILTGKRARAGRDWFLPGGWEELPSPDLPLESWKVPLYGLHRKNNGKLQAPLGWVAPLRPLHELFAQAWERVAAGDVPALEKARAVKGKI